MGRGWCDFHELIQWTLRRFAFFLELRSESGLGSRLCAEIRFALRNVFWEETPRPPGQMARTGAWLMSGLLIFGQVGAL